jgi:hypothetical protein
MEGGWGVHMWVLRVPCPKAERSVVGFDSNPGL